MPELPEVETTRRGVAPALIGHTVTDVIIRHRQLRWPVPANLATEITGRVVLAVRRRAKYLLIDFEHGSLIVHLGMSGSLRVLPCNTPVLAHDHIDVVLDSGQCLRFNDPRRFGSVLWSDTDPLQHPLLKHLAPEPLEDTFNGEYLEKAARGRKLAIKQLLMNSQIVVGVGNIYASEALFHAGIRPKRFARTLKRADFDRLVKAVKKVLRNAIRAGGTTLRDYVNAEGSPGYFRQKLFVYERADEACRVCETPIKQFRQGQRSTYFCPTCQH